MKTVSKLLAVAAFMLAMMGLAAAQAEPGPPPPPPEGGMMITMKVPAAGAAPSFTRKLA